MDNRQLAISVGLAKVDYDLGKPYIHLIISAPYNHVFTQLMITVCTPGKEETYWHIPDTDVIGQQSCVARIPLSELFEGKYIPSIFKVQIKAENVEGLTDPLTRELWLSDVQNIYQGMLSGLMGIYEDCTEISDDLIKQYLLLFGHQQALAEQDWDNAWDLFKLLQKNFSKCGQSTSKNTCGCHD